MPTVVSARWRRDPWQVIGVALRMAHQEIGVRVLERIRNEMELLTKVEQMPKMENRQMVMVLSPR